MLFLRLLSCSLAFLACSTLPGASYAKDAELESLPYALRAVGYEILSNSQENPVPTRFYVRDFGMKPTSKNNYDALHRILVAVSQIDGPAEILFEPGSVYRIGLPSDPEIKGSRNFNRHYAWHIKNANHLVINGQGCTLLFTNPQAGGICMEDSNHIELKNIKIDYDPVPYTLGTIVQVNLSEYWFDLKLDVGYPEPDQPYFLSVKECQGNWGLTIRDEPNNRRRYGPTAVFADRWEEIGERTWRFYPPKEGDGYNVQVDPLRASGLKSGDRYVHMARNWSQAVAGRNCDQVLWENITILSAPGLAFYPRGTSHHSIRNCHVKIKEGRIFSTTSDGIHMRGSRGNVLIEGCSFEGMADDGINVHSSALSVTETPAPNQVIVKKHTFSVRPGDELLIVQSASANVQGTIKVKTVQDLGANWLLTLDQSLPELSTGDGFGSSDNLYNLSESANPFVIRNCHFKDYRGRGILVSAHGGLIENNTFDMPEGHGVVLLYESTRWAEGPLAYDLTIRNNQFHARSFPHSPGIISQIITREGAKVDSRPFHNLRIEGNSFYEYGMPAVELRAVRDVKIRDNHIYCSDGAKRRQEDYAAVQFHNCDGISIDQLTVEDRNPRQVAAIKITADCGQEIEINDLEIDVSKTTQPVVDYRNK